MCQPEEKNKTMFICSDSLLRELKINFEIKQ